MGEPTRIHPLASRAEVLTSLPDALRVEVDAFTTTLALRLPEVTAEVTEALGVSVPTAPNTWVEGPGGRAVWLGPDEWLLTSRTEQPLDFESRVRALVGPLGGAATDVSAQRLALRLTGSAVRDILARGCSIDLHPRAFGPGQSAQTAVGQASVVVLAGSGVGEEDDIVLLVRSSFAGYLVDWLADAASDLPVG